MDKQALEGVLPAYPGYLRHRIEGRAGEWVVVLVSNEFEGRDEAERQADFWRYLEQNHIDRTILEYAFLFTDLEDVAAAAAQ